MKLYCRDKKTKLETIIEVESNNIPEFIVNQFEVSETPFNYQSIKQIKENKKKEIADAFIDSFNQGFLSPTLNVKVDCRKNANCNDIQNFQNLLISLQNSETSSVYIKDFSNQMQPLTTENLQILINEMIDYGIFLYQKKWQLEEQIEIAQSKEKLEKIEW